jgi:hypothetical protein
MLPVTVAPVYLAAVFTKSAGAPTYASRYTDYWKHNLAFANWKHMWRFTSSFASSHTLTRIQS